MQQITSIFPGTQLKVDSSQKRECDNSSVTSTWLYLPLWCVHTSWLGSRNRLVPWEEMLTVGLNPLENLHLPVAGVERLLGVQLVAELQVPLVGVELTLSFLVKMVTDTLVMNSLKVNTLNNVFHFKKWAFGRNANTHRSDWRNTIEHLIWTWFDEARTD